MKTEQQRIDELINRRLNEKANRFRPMDELQWLEYKRQHTKKQLDKSRKRMKQVYESLTQPQPITTKWGMVNLLINRGSQIIQGVKWGVKISDVIKQMIKNRKNKNKEK